MTKIKRKDAIRFIKNCIQFSRATRQLYSVMTEAEFAQCSYSEWAAKECLHYIERYPEMDVLDAVDMFADKMNKYCLCHNRPECSWMFSVAYDTAIFIYDQLLTYYELNDWKGKNDE